MNTPVNPGAQGGPADLDETDGGGVTAYRVGALTSQSDIDKYKNTYGSALESAAYKAEETGWDGLTKEQEAAQIAHAEAERELEENERLYQQTMQALHEEDDRLNQEMADMRSKTGHYKGKAVFLDPKTGKYFDEEGTELDQKGQQAMQEAAANGQHFEDSDLYQDTKKREAKVSKQMRDLEADNAYNVSAVQTAHASGNYAEADALLKQQHQALLKVQEIQQEKREIYTSHLNADEKVASVSNLGTDADADDMDNMFAAASPTASASSPPSDRNTSYANQVAPVSSNLSSTFVAVATTPVTDGTAPARTAIQNKVTAPAAQVS